jgi:hypothetical protein
VDAIHDSAASGDGKRLRCGLWLGGQCSVETAQPRINDRDRSRLFPWPDFIPPAVSRRRQPALLPRHPGLVRRQRVPSARFVSNTILMVLIISAASRSNSLTS